MLAVLKIVIKSNKRFSLFFCARHRLNMSSACIWYWFRHLLFINFSHLLRELLILYISRVIKEFLWVNFSIWNKLSIWNIYICWVSSLFHQIYRDITLIISLNIHIIQHWWDFLYVILNTWLDIRAISNIFIFFS